MLYCRGSNRSPNLLQQAASSYDGGGDTSRIGKRLVLELVDANFQIGGLQNPAQRVILVERRRLF